MKSWILIGVFVVVGLGVGALMSWRELATLAESPVPGPLASSTPAGKKQATARVAWPKVVVEQPEFNFGAGRHRQAGSHRWRIWNKGEGVLQIRDFWVECSQCTKLIVPVKTVPPGKSVEVTLEYSLITLQEDFRKSATLLTNDPNQPRIVLRLVGKVYHPVEAKPASLSFSGLRPTDEASGSVRLLAHFAKDFQITGISQADTTLADYFDVRTEQLAPEELPEGALAGYDLHVTVKPGLPLGSFRQTILVDTNLKDPARVEVPVQGSVVSPISVIGTAGWNPGRGVLKLGLVSGQQGITRTVKLMIRGVGIERLRLEPPQAFPDLIQVSYGTPTEIKAGEVVMVPLELRIPPGTAPVSYLGGEGQEQAEVHVKAIEPPGYELRFRVEFAVE